MYIYVYTYMYVYRYKHIFFIATAPFPIGATVSIPRIWYIAVPKTGKKKKNNNILVNFFSLKIGISHDILLPSGGRGGTKVLLMSLYSSFLLFFFFVFLLRCIFSSFPA